MRREKGVASLEALFSLAFLFLFMFLLWDSSKIIYDKSRLDTASQYAAQAGVLSFARSAPIDCQGNVCAPQALAAKNKARAVFDGNASLGILNSKGVADNLPQFKDFTIQYLCDSGTSLAWSNTGCASPKAYKANISTSQEIDWTIGLTSSFVTEIRASASATANNPEGL